MHMSDTTWVLLQLCVAGCTGLLMWGIVCMASKVWNWCSMRKGIRVYSKRHSSRRLRRRLKLRLVSAVCYFDGLRPRTWGTASLSNQRSDALPPRSH